MYLEFFGLKQKPFSHTPDPRFMYWNDGYREALASLRYGIQERKGFLAMIGEAGTGKTTLLRKLLDDLGSDAVSVFLFNPNATFDEILEFTLSELGIAASAGRRLAMLQRLNEFLLAAFAEARNTILVIDEAQDLEADVLESLRLLSNLEASQEKILQIVLSGQPELAQRLAQPNLRQLKQRIAVRCRLEPLQRSELADYVAARLSVAGATEEIFTAESLDPIWAFSNGIPRLINTVSDNALLLGYALGKKRIDAGIIAEVVADLRQLDIGTDVEVPAPAPVSTPISPAPPPAAPAPAASATESRVSAEPPPAPPAQLAADPVVASPPSAAAPPPHSSAPQRTAPRPTVFRASSGPTTPARAHAAAAAEPAERSRAVFTFAVIGLLAVVGMGTAAWVSRQAVDARTVQAGKTALPPPSAPKVAPAADAKVGAPVSESPAAEKPLDGETVKDRPGPGSIDSLAEQSVPNKEAAAPPVEAPKEPEGVAKSGDSPSQPPAEATADATGAPAADPVDPETRVAAVERNETAASAPAELHEEVRGKRVRVSTGDTLSNLAASEYGSANYTTLDMLRTVNPGVSDVDLILTGSELVFPDPGPMARILRADGDVSVLALTTPDAGKAERVQNALKSRLQQKVEMKPVPLGGGAKLYRVWVSNLPNEAAATTVATALGSILQDPSS